MSEWETNGEGRAWRRTEGGMEYASADYLNDLEAENKRLKDHGYVPNMLIDHDAPICEICDGKLEDHDREAMIVVEFHRLRTALEEIVAAMGPHAAPEGAIAAEMASQALEGTAEKSVRQ